MNEGPGRPGDTGRLAIDAFIWTVVAPGLAALAWAGFRLVSEPISPRWLVVAGLTVLSGAAALRVPAGNMSFSVADTFAFTALLLFGPAAATITVALDALTITLRLSRKSVHHVLFNVGASSLAMWLAGATFVALAGNAAVGPGSSPVSRLLPALAAAAAIYFLVNTGLVATVASLQHNRSPWKVWREAYFRLWLGYAGGAYVALLLVMYAREFDLRFLASLIPIPIILYYTFTTSLGRLDDEMRHLAELNLSYQRMIETLAHAVDARDQVTHDHIRRVQTACIRLAREFGVSDAAELSAIRAGALLHDIGKLAVPDRILNKAGKLTPAEFEEMKRHAPEGADILANAAFPYPVVPIVRHHHEAWDGSGYPDGICGVAIPLGARILSVVDCFDALTSDRPYRLRMTIAEALEVLRERRGQMYDPAVLDTFIGLVERSEIEVGDPAVAAADRADGTIPRQTGDAAADDARASHRNRIAGLPPVSK